MNYKPSPKEGNKITTADTTSFSTKVNRSHVPITKRAKPTEFYFIHQPQWFWRRHYQWSNSQRGFFWGTVISFTAICSAGCGMALTQFSWIEQAIARQIGFNYAMNKDNLPSLVNSLNVLLIEVDTRAEIADNRVLVLKFNSQTGSVEVINIPLASRVKLPGFGWATIAESYEYGGMALALEAVEQLTKTEVDRYLAATAETLTELTSSSNLVLGGCDSQILDCTSADAEIQRQSEQLAAIRQRLQNQAYFNNFEKTVARLKPDLDSNISMAEFVELASFSQKLKPNKIAINFWESDTAKSNFAFKQTQRNSQLPSSADLKLSSSKGAIAVKPLPTLLNSSIAVQNTTETPELGRRMVNYLRRQNFRDVYLIEHIPLKLTQTAIVADRQQLQAAKKLKGVLGFGNLKSAKNKSDGLIIRIGDDARNLPQH